MTLLLTIVHGLLGVLSSDAPCKQMKSKDGFAFCLDSEVNFAFYLNTG